MEAALTALLAPVAGGRSYWGRKPQSAPGTPQVEPARPYVVLQRISAVRGYHFQGDDGMPEYRVQIDVYADHWTTAHATGQQIVSLLSGYRNEQFQGIFIDGQRDLPAAAPGETSTLFRTSIDILIFFKET